MKLDDIDKKPFFEVPEGYFEQLPGKIQARIGTERKSERAFVFKYKLQYVIPAALILMVGLIWLVKQQAPTDVESMLATVDTEHLVAYLNDSELTTEDVMEEIDFSVTDIEEIESEVYQLPLEEESFDALLDDIDVENM